MDARHSKRIYIIQKLFEKHFIETSDPHNEINLKDTIEFTDDFELKFDKKEADNLINSIEENQEKIDKIIEKYAPEWPINQIVKTDLEILRLAIYEGFLEALVPQKVAINEGIELAREFGGESSRKFVSGVLGSLYESTKSDAVN
jgi:N utilization substance protein B